MFLSIGSDELLMEEEEFLVALNDYDVEITYEPIKCAYVARLVKNA